MESHDYHSALAQLAWQVDLGATEAICDAPVDRFALDATKAKTAPQKASATPTPVMTAEPDPVALATAAAAAASNLTELAEAIARFDQCELKRGAKNTVFADGNANSRLMIIGEAPGRDEDREGKPFVGAAGQLLDKMFAAIQMDRHSDDAQKSLYITNILPWRPPQNRDPDPQEIAVMVPFVQRHIALIDPDVIVLMGNIACTALLGQRGITRLRGKWTEVAGKPALPMFHPAYLLRTPTAKRDAWADLQDLQSRLATG